MKIHVEFNSIAEMVNFSKFAGSDLVQPPVQQPKKDKNLPIGAASWEDAFKRTEANLERAYERIREFEHIKHNNQVIANEIHKIERKKEEAREAERKMLEKDEIGELELSVRAHNCLMTENIYTISNLITKREYDLRKIPNMGKVSIKEIKEALASRKLALAG